MEFEGLEDHTFTLREEALKQATHLKEIYSLFKRGVSSAVK